MNRIEDTSRSDLDLLAAACSPTATDEELRAFESACAEDEGLARLFLEFCHFEWVSQLRERSGLANRLTKTSLNELIDDTADSTGGAPSPMPPSPRSKSWLDRASRRPVRPALAVAALVMISVVAWMGVTMVKTQIAGGGKKGTDERQQTKKPDFVAWLMKAHKTQWIDGTEPKKTKLMPGQRLAIAKGLIEIQYRTRAVVVIEGPAEFFVGSQESGVRDQESEGNSRRRKPMDREKVANSGFLALGKLVARVEGKKADGFTIDTPSGRVEDHGTEFGVEVLEGGAAEFVVLLGQVDVIREASGSGPGQRVRLTKGQGAFVEAKGGTIAWRREVDTRLVSAMRSRLKTMWQAKAANAAVIIWNGTTVTHMANDGVAANNFAQLIGGTAHEARHVDYTGGGGDADPNGNVVVNDTVGGRLITFVADPIGAGQFGANAVNTGDANFTGVLTTGYSTGGNPIILGTINPLTSGTSYTVQIWSHWGGSTNPMYQGDEAVATTFSGQISGGGNPATGNSVTDNPWFITGTFVASGPTQTVTWTGPNNPWDAYLVTETPPQPWVEKDQRKASPKYEDRNTRQKNTTTPSEGATIAD